MKIAICIVAFNRIKSLGRLLYSISNGFYDNDTVDLIISIDNSGKDDVENLAKSYEWVHGNKKVVTYEKNLGLKTHILKCGDFVYDYDGLIVLEDDVFVAPSFYLYSKACVEKFKDNDQIAGISLYSFRRNYHNRIPFEPLKSDSDVFLMQNAQSWGQVWMHNQWLDFKKWYNCNSEDFSPSPYIPKSIAGWKRSWLKYHTKYCIDNNKFFVYPYISFSTNCEDLGDHAFSNENFFQVPLFYGKKSHYNLNPTIYYDAFFENINLPNHLNLQNSDVCIDLYGEKKNNEKKKFLLTLQKLDYKIIDSFALQFRPIENNIIYSIKGEDIFLYDTQINVKNSKKIFLGKKIVYFYNLNIGRKNFIALVRYLIKNRL